MTAPHTVRTAGHARTLDESEMASFELSRRTPNRPAPLSPLTTTPSLPLSSGFACGVRGDGTLAHEERLAKSGSGIEEGRGQRREAPLRVA